MTQPLDPMKPIPNLHHFLKEHPETARQLTPILERFYRDEEYRSSSFWQNHHIALKGDAFEIVGGTGEERDNLYTLLSQALNLPRSPCERLELYAQVQTWQGHIRAYFDSASLAQLKVTAEEGGHLETFRFPVGLCLKSELLRELFLSCREKSEIVSLPLPPGMTLNDVKEYLRFYNPSESVPQRSITEWTRLLRVHNFLLVDDPRFLRPNFEETALDAIKQEVAKSLPGGAVPILDPELLRYLSNQQVCKLVEFLIQKIVELRMTTLEETAIEAFTSLRTLPQFPYLQEHCAKLDLTHERFRGLNDENLRELSTLFPRVKSLSLAVSVATEIPAKWCETLEQLFVENSRLASLARPMPRLKRLEVNNCANLDNLSGLTDSQTLKSLILGSCNRLTALPTRCVNLHFISIYDCPTLENLAALDNSPSLEELHLSRLNITSPPLGLTRLSSADLRDCPQMRSLAPLNNATHLRRLTIGGIPATHLPMGLIELREFTYNGPDHENRAPGSNGRGLESLAPLEKLPKLEEVNIEGNGIGKLPLLPALKIFATRNCPHLTDITSLDGSQTLQELRLRGSAVTALPRGCSQLGKVELAQNPDLHDLTPLKDSSELYQIDIALDQEGPFSPLDTLQGRPPAHAQDVHLSFPHRSPYMRDVVAFAAVYGFNGDDDSSAICVVQRALRTSQVLSPAWWGRSPYLLKMLQWTAWLYSGMPELPLEGRWIAREAPPYAVTQAADSLCEHGWISSYAENALRHLAETIRNKGVFHRRMMFENLPAGAQRIVKLALRSRHGEFLEESALLRDLSDEELGAPLDRVLPRLIDSLSSITYSPVESGLRMRRKSL